MGITMRPDGTLDFGSVDDLVAFKVKMQAQAGSPAPRVTPAGNGTPATNGTPAVDEGGEAVPGDAWSRFIAHLRGSETGKRQIKFMVLLKEQGGIKAKDAVDALGLDDITKLPGVISGVKKNAKRFELKVEKLMKTFESGYGKGKIVSYKPGPLLNQNEVKE